MISGVSLGLHVNLVNRFITHFGFPEIYYSSKNNALSNEINSVGNQMGDWSSQVGQYQSQSSQAVTSVASAVTVFQPLFIGVWNKLPSWVLVLLAVSLAIVFGRKILGR